jgi:hypothetical protein
MKKQRIRAKVADLVLNEGQLEWLPKNPRQWTREDVEKTRASLRRDPDFQEDSPLKVIEYEGKLLVFAGNLRTTSAREEKWETFEAILYTPENEDDRETIKRRAILDNGSYGSWDYDILANEWDDMPLSDWGVSTPADWSNEMIDVNLESVDEIERKKKEFEERMAAGEISEEDEEYQEFLEKFKLKKTTDDCYTPAPVYEKVAQYVAETYGVSPASFLRPFYPGGDYQKEIYPKDCVVVDNPPFSIMSEILQFYKERGIRFFLFAPTLTLFSSSSSSTCTALPCTLAVIYENGASVNTSFLTNLEPSSVRFRSAPKLQSMVQEGIDEFAKTLRKSLPKYSYPPHIITSTWVGILSRLGIEFSVPVNESEGISCLDSQKPSGKAIFGKGYIVSDAVKAEREKAEREKAEREKAEREKAEREKAEREKAERWELSEREYAIIDKLNKKKGTKE